MAKDNQGSNYIKGNTQKSIVDIDLKSGVTLSVFPGSLSPNDILLKYKESSEQIDIGHQSISIG